MRKTRRVQDLSRRLAESASGIRWHRARVWTRLVHARAFGSLGDGTVIVKPLQLRGVDRMEIGRRCAIYEGAWLQCEPGCSGRLIVGDDVYLGHRVHLHAVDDVTIGDNCMLTDLVTVSSGRHQQGDRSSVLGSGSISIGSGVFVGEGAKILGGVTIGDDAVIGAGAVVTSDVPASTVVAGVPARPLRQGRG